MDREETGTEKGQGFDFGPPKGQLTLPTKSLLGVGPTPFTFLNTYINPFPYYNKG